MQRTDFSAALWPTGTVASKDTLNRFRQVVSRSLSRAGGAKEEVISHSTSVSLLQRLRQPDDQAAWLRFVQLYTPLLYWWTRRAGLQSSDGADLVQDVMVLLVQKLPKFNYDGRRNFRGWLQTVIRNKWREKQRRAVLPLVPGEAGLDALEATTNALGEQEYYTYVARRALELMQEEFRPTTWKACWEQVVNGRPAAEGATELGISEGAAYVAKSRVLLRLREELADLME